MPLGLIVNELVTNAIQHSRPADEGGSVHVKLEAHVGNFLISVSDPGDGPAAAQVGELGTRHDGLGTRIVQTLARQNRHETGSTTARSVDEIALIRDTINHYGPVFIASLSIRIRRAGVQKKFGGRAGRRDGYPPRCEQPPP